MEYIETKSVAEVSERVIQLQKALHHNGVICRAALEQDLVVRQRRASRQQKFPTLLIRLRNLFRKRRDPGRRDQ